MKINQIHIELGDACQISQSQQQLVVNPGSLTLTCAKQIKVEFEDTFSIEMKEDALGGTVLVVTAGGIRRAIDTAALQHLVSMTY